MDIKIERMTAEDIDKVYALEPEIFPDDPWNIEWFREGLSDPAGHYYLAFCDGKLVGYSGMYVITSKTPNYCKIAKLAVKENFRRKGIGKALLQKMLDTARAFGLDRAKLEVNCKNSAIALYESFGFITEELKEQYFEKSGDDAYIMWLYGLNKQ